MEAAKPSYQSKTVIANVLLLALAIFAEPQLAAVLGPNAMARVATAGAAINLVLRFLTKGPIALL